MSTTPNPTDSKQPVQPSSQWPEWAKNIVPAGSASAVLLVVFVLFIQPMTSEVGKVNERLFSIEKKTETLIALGNEKLARLESDMMQLKVSHDNHVNNPNLHQYSIMNFEKKITKLELEISALKEQVARSKTP